MARFTKPTGTQDILPEDQAYWTHVLNHVTRLAHLYGFERLDPPLIEHTELFARGVGDATDIVEKEMYTFKDKGGESLTLRPEFTAGVVRAYIENGMQVLPQPVKLYSIGPLFRYERPQAGRFRQFHQFNAEIFGTPDPLADLEIMLLAWDIYAGLGFTALSFQLNSTGCPACRPGYVEALKAHYRAHETHICDDCRRRLDKNPLRVLDCKQDTCQPVIASAPKITDYLCSDCQTHFATLRQYLDHLKRPYTINHRLVRGLDYYTNTVFEVWAEGIGAQAAVCGGGRYNGLMALLGGPSQPGVGFAVGLERTVLLLKAHGIAVPELPPPPVYIAYLGEQARLRAVQLLVEVRQAGWGAQMAMGGSLKAQLRQADKRGARLLLILGEDELARQEITLRDLAQATQETLPLAGVLDALRVRLTQA